MSEIWLGIDPGLAIIGWSVLTISEEQDMPKLVDSGTIETSKKLSTPQRLVEIERDMIDLVKEFNPNYAAIEMPFFGRQIKASGGVQQALGVITLVLCREAGIDPFFIHQSSWKCHLGNGRYTKDEVAEIIQHLFDMKTLPIDDIVDAIGIGLAGLQGVRNAIY